MKLGYIIIDMVKSFSFAWELFNVGGVNELLKIVLYFMIYGVWE